MVTGSAARAGWFRSVYRATMRLWLRFRLRDYSRLRVERVAGLEIIVLPGVFNGALVRTGAFLATTLDGKLVPHGTSVLDLGTGSGIGAVFAARWAARVVATDINPEAVRCSQINALAQHLEHKIEIRCGDLFEPVGAERFDIILFNPPFYRGRPRDPADYAWRSPDAFDRFLRELSGHLNPGGRAFIVLSTDGEIYAALESAQHLDVRAIRSRDLVNETLTIYQLQIPEERS